MRRVIRTLHVSLVVLVTAGVLVQATLAGQFISGTSDALGLHGAVGGLLELAALVLLVVAIAHRVIGERSRVALIGSVALALGLTVQAGLGWAPGEVPTAVHVPLGVCIFAGSLLLSVAMRRVGVKDPRTVLVDQPV
jgi:hypothetical protein